MRLDEDGLMLLIKRVVGPWLLRKEELRTEILEMPMKAAAELAWFIIPCNRLPFPSKTQPIIET